MLIFNRDSRERSHDSDKSHTRAGRARLATDFSINDQSTGCDNSLLPSPASATVAPIIIADSAEGGERR